MKNTFLMLAFTILSVSTFNAAHAQQAMTDAIDDFPIEGVDQPYRFPNIDWVYAESNNTIDARVVQNFEKLFPEINNPVWYKTNDGSFIASFKEHDINTTVVYNKKAKWHHIISYYSENKLAEDLWHTVKSTYYAYDILNVTEVHFENETAYIILLQNHQYIKKIRLYNGDIEEVEHLVKG